MPLSLTESQAANEIAQFLYDFLPGSPHPYADQNLSFPGAAQDVGVGHLWRGGSKLPAITNLLEKTLETRRDLFCNLMLEIVRKGLIYRNNKGNSITCEEIRELNELIVKVKFKIPELWDPAFLDSLPTANKIEKEETSEKTASKAELDNLKTELIKINDLEPVPRGFAFEKFLQELFAIYGLAPRSSFRLVGEQIDGSFQIETDTYLIEAKWQEKPTNQADLLIFREKVESKSAWSRGLFISYSGFTPDGLEAFARGRSTNIIGMNSQDIYFILDGEMSLPEAINIKARRAAETGEFFVSVYDLSR
ncbi:MAG: restriction endonuclease [Anaerolineae bacterium]|nr:restriction endonuclease [Anaerolineae bacterium]MCO5193266.1 restriction endonuclease [Anaerolineae bacterium]MCO5207069.1 restriction endonuclease [Anaerolineae bacterium]